MSLFRQTLNGDPLGQPVNIKDENSKEILGTSSCGSLFG